MSSRKISVYTTGGKSKEFQSSATTYRELQADFAKAGVTYSGMKVINGADKKTFDHPDGRLDDGNMKIFLYPQKTKSGISKKDVDAMPYSVLRATIKSAFEHDKLKANGHFNKDKNYTTKSTDVLKSLLSTYKGTVDDATDGATVTPGKQETKKVETKTVAKAAPVKGKANAADLVKSVSKAATAKTKEVPAKVKEAVKPAAESTVDLKVLTSILSDVDSLREKVLSLFPKELAQKAESLVEEDEDEVMKEFRAVGAGLDGIKSF